MKPSPFEGIRVEISPSYDLWMRGARFGTIRRIEKGTIAVIKMDHRQVRKLARIPLADCTAWLARSMSPLKLYQGNAVTLGHHTAGVSRLFARNPTTGQGFWIDPDGLEGGK